MEPPAKQQNLGLFTAGSNTMGFGGFNSVSRVPQSDLARPFSQYMYDASCPNQSNQDPANSFMQCAHSASTQAPAQPLVLNLEPELKGKILVQGIQRDKVARKSRYDPRTICRDVLLVTGRHSEMRPLNQHLFDLHEYLQHHSVNVEGDKLDLATIRWDLIDPGEPIAEETKAASGASGNEVSDASTDADDEGEEKSIETGEQGISDDTDHAPRRKPSAKPFEKRGRGRSPGIRKSIPDQRTSRVGESSASHANRLSKADATATTASSVVSARSSLAPNGTPYPATSSLTPVNKLAKMSDSSTPVAIGYSAFKQHNVRLDDSGSSLPESSPLTTTNSRRKSRMASSVRTRYGCETLLGIHGSEIRRREHTAAAGGNEKDCRTGYGQSWMHLLQ